MTAMNIVANDSYSFSGHSLIGLVVAVVAHLALFSAFPTLMPTKVIEAALHSNATMLNISITSPKITQPDVQPRVTDVPPVVKPTVQKRPARKVMPQQVLKQPRNVKISPNTMQPATKAMAVKETNPSPAKKIQPSVIPETTEVSLRGKRIAPVYPKRALRMKQEGTVMLKVLVDQTGRQKEIQLAISSQFPLLDSAALEAVRKWRFNPTKRGGETILSWVQVPVEFRIR